MKRKAAFFNNGTAIDRVYGHGRKEIIADKTDLCPHVINIQNFDDHQNVLAATEVIFSSWGMPALSPVQLQALPSLKAVFYAAGTVQYFARPFLDRGVKVVSAWAANAIPVAEFTLAQILLSCKGYFRNTRQCRSYDMIKEKRAYTGPGIFGVTVALIGAGKIAQYLIQLLKPFNIDVVVVDPFLPDDKAAALGVRKISLQAAFSTAFIVSNHLPDLPATQKMLTGKLFRSMPEGATFINTGRGAQVVEDELITALRERPDLTALLDVTFPEPPEPDSGFYTLPNVQLSSHIAGSLGNEVVRMADFMIREFDAWCENRPLQYVITLEMLETMA